MKSRRKSSIKPPGLYIHSSPPAVVAPQPGVVRQWLRGGEVDKLEALVLQGHGHKLLGEYAADLKVRAFLKTIPAYLARIDMLHEAACKGSLTEVKALLKDSSDRNWPRRRLAALALSKDTAGTGLLHKAVYHDHRELAKWLVDNYPRAVHVLDRDGRSALHYCGRCADPESMWTVLSHAGADPALQDTHGYTPAYYMDHPQEVRLPATPLDTPSTRFNSSDDELVVKPANIRIWIHDQDLGRLQRVVWEGYGDKLRTETSQHPSVKQFLAAVPYIMGVIKDVHTAASNNDLILLKKKTEPPVPREIFLAKDVNGLSPLHKAAGLGHIEAVRAILATCPEAVTKTDRWGRTALHYAAAAKGSGATYDLLLDYHAEETVLDKLGNPPTYYLKNGKELDQKLLKVIPEAPRTANIFPRAWEWSSLQILLPTQAQSSNGDSAFEDDTPDKSPHNGPPIPENKEQPRPQTYDIEAEADEGVEEEEEEKERGYNGDIEEQEGHYEAEYAEVEPEYDLTNEPTKQNEETEELEPRDVYNVQVRSQDGVDMEDKTGRVKGNVLAGKTVVNEGLNLLGKNDMGRNKKDNKQVSFKNTAKILSKKLSNEKSKVKSQMKRTNAEVKKGIRSTGSKVTAVEKNINQIIENIDKTIEDDVNSTTIFLQEERKRGGMEVSAFTDEKKNMANQLKGQDKLAKTPKDKIIETAKFIKHEKDNINNTIENSLQSKKLGTMRNRIKITQDFIEREKLYSGSNRGEIYQLHNDLQSSSKSKIPIPAKTASSINQLVGAAGTTGAVLNANKSKQKVEGVYKTAKSKLNPSNSKTKIDSISENVNNGSSTSGNSASTTLADGNTKNERRFTMYKPIQNKWRKAFEITKPASVEESRKKVEELRAMLPKRLKNRNNHPQQPEPNNGAAVAPAVGPGEENIRRVVEVGDIEQLAALVLAGEGEALARHHSSNPDVQMFIDNIPTYLSKIQRVHHATREGSLRELQSALDRRKFAVARETESPLRLTPLHLAVLYGRTSVLRFLAARFPETLRAVDTSGRTPLHYAAIVQDNGHYYNVLKTLGADDSIEDNEGKTAQFYKEFPDHVTHEQLIAEFEGKQVSDVLQHSAITDLADKDLSEKAIVTTGFPVFGPEDGQYLASSLGQPLIKGLTEVASKRPHNPVRYLADYLYTFDDDLENQDSQPKVLQDTYTVEKEHQLMAPPPIPDDETEENQQVKVGEDEDERQEIEPPLSVFKHVQRDEYGQMILHFAMARTHGRNALFQLMQEVDCNVALRDELYRTARDVAIQVNIMDNVEAIDKYVVSLAATGQLDKLRELVVEGYDHVVDTRDENATITEAAAARGQASIVAFLETINSFEDRRERLHRAVRLGSVGQVQELLRAQPGLAVARNHQSRTSLHIAVLGQHDAVVRHIASQYPQTLAIGDNLMRTPLHYAMGVERVETLSKILIQTGATRVFKDLKGRQPSYYFMNKSDIQKLQDEEEMLRV